MTMPISLYFPFALRQYDDGDNDGGGCDDADAKNDTS